MNKTVRKPKIFISYRRSDASANAGRLFDWLGHQFGRSLIFLDTDKIQAGAQFPKILADRLADCDILLVVIGPEWLTTTNENGQRLNQSDDFVRREIETALVDGKTVIPVLVQGSIMPDKDDLPLSIQQLVIRNAIQIGDASFERDFDILVDDILGRPRGFIHRELDRLQRMVLVASRSAVIIPILALVLALACFMKVFDLFSLDTRASSYLMWAADKISAPAAESNVLLVTIDAESEQQIQPFDADHRDIWRKHHARLIDRAVNAGAKAVVFDMFLVKETSADNLLAKAVKNAKSTQTRIVFGVNSYQNETPGLIASLIKAGAEWGSVCAVKRLGQLFMLPLLVRQQEENVNQPESDNHKVSGHIPALALIASRAEKPDAIDLSRREILFQGSSNTQAVQYSSLERINWNPVNCQALKENDEVAMMLIRIPDSEYWNNSVRHLSYADILKPEQVKAEQLKNRIILVGVTNKSDRNNRDLHTITRFFSRTSISGVELQASAIADIQAERVINTPTIDWQVFIMCIMAVFGAASSFFTATRSIGWQRVIFFSVILIYISVAVLSAASGFLLNILYDFSAFFVIHKLLRWIQQRALHTNQPELK